MAWPTTSNPRTNFVTVRFTDDEAADLDLLGSSRSESIRDAVARVVAAEKRRLAKKKLVAGEEIEDAS
jgi:hypothetical protein